MGRRTRAAFENRVRAVRECRGWSQADLARACGLSRQALSAIEAGRYVPNTAVALRLAQALGCAVEELFVPSAPASVEAVLAEAARPGDRVLLSRVGGRLVAWPLRGAEASLPANGTLVDFAAGRVRVRPLPGAAHPDRVLLVAGCDPALRLAASLAERGTGWQVRWLPMSSAGALQAAQQGLVHVAGMHLASSEDPNGVRALRRWFGQAPAVVVTTSFWTEGLLVRPAARIRVPEDLLRRGVSVVNREVGSGSRMVLDRWLARAGLAPQRIRGYGRELASHLAVAEAVAAGLADAGPGVLPVARAYGLDFIPIEQRRCEVVVPQALWQLPAVQDWVQVLADRAYRRELAHLGYDPGPAGTTRAVG